MTETKTTASLTSPIGSFPPRGLQLTIGYEIAEWRDGFARVRLDLDGRHTNRASFVHGGLFSIIMDSAGGLCGCFTPEADRVRRCVTLALTTNFIAQPTTAQIFATGTLQSAGRTIFFASLTVHDSVDTLCAQGSGTFRYIKGSGDPAGIPHDGLG